VVVEVAKKYFGVQPSERLRIHIGDGRTFLKRSRETWDLIVIDAYTTNRYGNTIPAHLATREFFQEVGQHLSSGGILHFHCSFGRSLLPALQKTIAEVFASTWTSEGEILASNVPLLFPAGDHPRALAADARGGPSAFRHLREQPEALLPRPAGDPPPHRRLRSGRHAALIG
jgi:hypothetical protein